MRIGVISRGEGIHSTRRLLRTGDELGVTMELIPVLRSTLQYTGDGEQLRVNGRELPPIDAVIPRIATFMPDLGLAVLRHFERNGVRTLNSAEALRICRNKLYTLERLSAAGVPTPPTIYVKDLEQMHSTVAAVGGAPVIVKTVSGAQGRGVVLCDSVASAVSVMEAFLVQNREILVQRFLREAEGRDYRVFVLADEVVAAMERIARPGDFRANLHQGGRVSGWQPDAIAAELAVRAATTLGLELAGVDLIYDGSGWVVLEVNGSPGLEGIERASGVDIAAAMIAHLQTESSCEVPSDPI